MVCTLTGLAHLAAYSAITTCKCVLANTKFCCSSTCMCCSMSWQAPLAASMPLLAHLCCVACREVFAELVPGGKGELVMIKRKQVGWLKRHSSCLLPKPGLVFGAAGRERLLPGNQSPPHCLESKLVGGSNLTPTSSIDSGRWGMHIAGAMSPCGADAMMLLLPQLTAALPVGQVLLSSLCNQGADGALCAGLSGLMHQASQYGAKWKCCHMGEHVTDVLAPWHASCRVKSRMMRTMRRRAGGT